MQEYDGKLEETTAQQVKSFANKMPSGEKLRILCPIDKNGYRYAACYDHRMLIGGSQHAEEVLYSEITSCTLKDERNRKVKSIDDAMSLVLQANGHEYGLPRCSLDFPGLYSMIMSKIGANMNR